MTSDVPTPAVSVIVPARDAESTLPRTLDALASQRIDAPFEIIIVDNGSEDGTAELAERHAVQPRVLRRRRGEGPGVARNDGVLVSRAPVLAFTDADCEPSPTWLSEGLSALATADLVVGAVSPPPGVSRGPFDRTLWVVNEHGLYETANLFVRREWFDRVGGFHDWGPDSGGASGAQHRPFGEDAWFAWSARRLGARTAFEPRAIVHHAVFPGTAREYVAEQWRLRHFPGLIALIPELRGTFLWNRWFLNARTASFDAAAVGLIAVAVTRSVFPLALAAPYATLFLRELLGWRWRGRQTVSIGFVIGARDALAFAALVAGSVRSRSIVL